IVAASLTQFNGRSIGQVADSPCPTVTAQVLKTGILAASLEPTVTAANLIRIGQSGGNGSYANSVSDPLTTVVSKAEHCLVAAHMIHMNHGEKQWSDVQEPLRTILAGANHHGLVTVFLTKYFGSARDGQGVDSPLHTITAKARFGLVTVNGFDYECNDIGLRMLTARELYRCQGFPDDYVIEIPVMARRGKGPEYRLLKPLSKTAQVRMCGNSVPPQLAEALVRANFAAEAAPLPKTRRRRLERAAS
ncbi:DNA cytosine methyltransferase, partial [Singulisphaera rosea]